MHSPYPIIPSNYLSPFRKFSRNAIIFLEGKFRQIRFDLENFIFSIWHWIEEIQIFRLIIKGLVKRFWQN